MQIHQHKMDQTKCQAYKKDGTQCTTKHKINSLYCGRHEKYIYDNGPHRFSREQLAFKHYSERKIQNQQYMETTKREGITQEEKNQLYDQNIIAEAELNVRHNQEIRQLNVAQEAERQRLGYDPDGPARNRVRMGDIKRSLNRYQTNLNREIPREYVEIEVESIMRFTNILEDYLREEQHDTVFQEGLRISIALAQTLIERYLEQLGNPIVVNGNTVRRQETQLARITKDSQNVHTKVVVDSVKSNIKFLFDTIQVPPGYGWNMNVPSLTYRDIIVRCNLSVKAVKQFSNMYLSDEQIYDMQSGIYGLVMDRVWQFILSSEHRNELIKALRSELTDNVNTCPQGNLSRLACNVLSGYLEGIKQAETPAEILGREFPKLMEIQDVNQRIEKGRTLLTQTNYPENMWNEWLEALQ